MKMKRIVKRHAGLIIAAFSIVVMFPLAALLCQIDGWMDVTGPDGDGPGPMLALQGTVIVVVIGILIELINPFEGRKQT